MGNVRLKASVLSRMRNPENKHVRSKLCLKLDASYSTITRYMDKNDIILTSIDALEVISEELGVSKELLTEEIQ